MPDGQYGSEETLAKYDAMCTEALQQILREDSLKPAGEKSDTNALLSIMEVLAKRRSAQSEGRSPVEALASFKKKYMEQGDPASNASPVRWKRHLGNIWKKGVAAVVALLVLMIGSSVTTQAFDSVPTGVVGEWTDGSFHFSYFGTPESIASGSEQADPSPLYPTETEKEKYMQSLFPTWIPDRYKERETITEQYPQQTAYVKCYEFGEKLIVIEIADHLPRAQGEYEKDDTPVEIYSHGGVDYYIFRNKDYLNAVWLENGVFECSIAGFVSVPEMKQMINSIQRG